MKKVIFFTVVTILVVFLFSGCQFFPEDPKAWDFGSPAEILENPDVEDAIDETGFTVHTQNRPPWLEGKYSYTGKIVDSQPSSLTGMSAASTIEFYNQTSGGEISMKETVAYYGSVTATGNFITGSGNSFTVWQEAEPQEIPSDSVYREDPSKPITMIVVAIISGRVMNNGDLDGDTLTVVTAINNLDEDVISASSVLDWYETDAYFDKQGVSSSISRSIEEISESLGILIAPSSLLD